MTAGPLASLRALFRRVWRNLVNLAMIGAVCLTLYAALSYGMYLKWGVGVPDSLAASGIDPSMIATNQRYFGYQFSQASGASLWQSSNPEARRYGLILGTSSVRSDLDYRLFKASAILNVESIVTGNIGPSFGVMRDYLSRLSRFADFKPEFVILGVHPYMSKGYSAWKPDAGETRRLHIQRFPVNWLYANRQYFSNYTANALSDLRAVVFRRLHMARLPVAYRPNANPWQPQISSINEDYTEADWQTAKGRGSVNWALQFDEVDQNSEELKYFVKAINLVSGAWRVPVFVVLMPQAPYLNNDTPERAFELITDILRSNFGHAVPLLDLSTAFPVEDFFDASHLNLEGQRKFSEQLGQWFRSQVGPEWHAASQPDGGK